MITPLQAAKRALVSLLLTLARAYNVTLDINRDSSDAKVKEAFRKVVRRVHPDRGGSVADTQKLNNAKEEWEKAGAARRPKGRPKDSRTPPTSTASPAAPLGLGEPAESKGIRINAAHVLLTYKGIESLDQWLRYVDFCQGHTREWTVKHWCATLEGPSLHIHVMLQFRAKIDRHSKYFSFENIPPNASTDDLCGEGINGRRFQQSVDRGMFYVWANKKGTVRDMEGGLCVVGNYAPCWTKPRKGVFRYEVRGKWPEKLWKQYKLETSVYEEYLFLCRDGVPARKRNLEAVRRWEKGKAIEELIAANTKRIRSNPDLYKPFPVIPEATEWLAQFKDDALRYPILIVKGPSACGKTEWANSLFKNPLEVKVGDLEHFPDRLRRFDRDQHDGLILDDVRNLEFLGRHQEKLQGKYHAADEFASTPSGDYSYDQYLFAVPIVVTVNGSTKNLDYLNSHDWLGKPANRVVVNYDAFAQ